MAELNAQKKYVEQKLAQQSHEAAAKDVELLQVGDERTRLREELRASREQLAATQGELRAERERRAAAEESRNRLQFDYAQRLEQVAFHLLLIVAFT